MLFDCIAFGISYGLFLSVLYRFPIVLIVKIMMFSSIFQWVMVLLNLKDYSLLPTVFLTAFLLMFHVKKIISSLALAFAAAIMQFIFVALCSSMIVFINPSWYLTDFYHRAISILLILYSLALKKIVKGPVIQYSANKRLILVLTLTEMLIVIFIIYILPTLSNYGLDTQQKFVFYIAFSILMILVLTAVFNNFVIRKDKLHLEEKQKLYSISQKKTEEKHNDILFLKHFYTKLYYSVLNHLLQGELKEAIAFLQKYITPIHEEKFLNVATDEIIKQIDAPLIQNLLYETIIKVQQVLHKELEIQIDNKITIDPAFEMKLYQILSVFTVNAIEEITTQERGRITIQFHKYDNKTLIIIENTLKTEIEMSKINQASYSTKDGHSGVGLTGVFKIIQDTNGLEHLNYIKNGVFIQQLIIED